MKSALTRTIAFAGLALTVAAQAEDADLTVRQVSIFSSGVAHFVGRATVDGTQSAQLSFRTSQINDILKSLVVQDFDGGSVSVVQYASQDPIEKTLASFGVDLTGNPTLAALLNQLRGEPAAVVGPQTVEGIILGVEYHRITLESGEIISAELLNMVTDDGMVQLQLDSIQSISLKNPKVNAELREALATLAGSHSADKKSVEILFEGQGKRTVQAAYLLEAPIWKTTYRLVLEEDQSPFLQGWATVDNATEEDWEDVQLRLISGRPISFRMDLYTPLYIPRPLEELELYASLRPPEFEGDMRQQLEAREQEERMPSAAPLAGRRGRGRDGTYAGAELKSLGYADAGAADALGRLGIEGVAASVTSVATAEEAGELFEYAIPTPVSIPRQHSAMLPIVNASIEGEKVSVYNPEFHPKYPLNGLQLINASGLNLVQGPITVFDDGVYAGDAMLPDLKPDEKRLIAYALDLGMEVTIDQQPHPDSIVSLKIVKGVLHHEHRYVDSREYTIKNKESKKRTLVIEQQYGDEWTLVEPKEPEERTASLSRFKADVKPQSTDKLTVTLQRTTTQYLQLADTGLDQIRYFVQSRVISPKVREAMETLIKKRTELDQVSRQRQQTEQERREVVNDQARIRENLKSLDRNSDVYRRQLEKFDALETEIEKLTDQVETLRAKEEQLRKALEDWLLSLNL